MTKITIMLSFSIYFFFFILLSLPLYTQKIIILGVTQDGGYPHIGCSNKCCVKVYNNRTLINYPVSLALMDTTNLRWWLFEATPNITEQLNIFRQATSARFNYLPDGIFITHAHIGHFTGLMYLGREAMSSKAVPVYVLPKMGIFLKNNGPWNQLVSLNNISTIEIKEDSIVSLSEKISVLAFTVPHRDEFSETAGLKIHCGNKKILFIPDIDKWEKWRYNIIDEVKGVDIALLDGTFYDSNELTNRDISEIPHPFVIETISIFKDEEEVTRKKIYFIHLNHTNPLLWDENKKKKLIENGFNVATLRQLIR